MKRKRKMKRDDGEVRNEELEQSESRDSQLLKVYFLVGKKIELQQSPALPARPL